MQKAANRPFARLLPLRSEDENFESSLKTLDRISSRTYDKLYAFIVRKNKTDWEEILKNEVWYLAFFLDMSILITLPLSFHCIKCILSLSQSVSQAVVMHGSVAAGRQRY